MFRKPFFHRLGDALVLLDYDGRLLSLGIIQPRTEQPNALSVQPDWSGLLSEAGMGGQAVLGGLESEA